MDPQPTSPAIDQPDTSVATARAEVIAAARRAVLAYERNPYTMSAALQFRLDTLRDALRQFDATAPDA